MRASTLCVSSVAALALATGAPAATPQPPTASPASEPLRVALSPGIVLLGRTAAVTVTGVHSASLEMRAAGATHNLGKRLPWTPLLFDGAGWHGVLPAPEFRGIYRVELRVRRGAPILRSERWLLRVYARGMLSRPAFRSPEEVARWWVTTLPGRARLVALKRWSQPAYDLRDPRLHQLIVIAYSIAGHSAIRERLGIFVTAAREHVNGAWRLLEARTTP